METNLGAWHKYEEVAYPAAPWEMRGQLWMGGFTMDRPIPITDSLQHLGNPNLGLVTLVRYQSGTLQYDELVIGTLVRKGWRVGIWVHCIWVDSIQSVWGGRRIWGLPKNMASFAWDGDIVKVSDEDGALLSLVVNREESTWPSIWIPSPGFGLIDEEVVFTNASMWMSFGKNTMQITDWSPRFPYCPQKNKPSFAIAAKPFRLKVPAGQKIKA